MQLNKKKIGAVLLGLTVLGSAAAYAWNPVGDGNHYTMDDWKEGSSIVTASETGPNSSIIGSSVYDVNSFKQPANRNLCFDTNGSLDAAEMFEYKKSIFMVVMPSEVEWKNNYERFFGNYNTELKKLIHTVNLPEKYYMDVWKLMTDDGKIWTVYQGLKHPVERSNDLTPEFGDDAWNDWNKNGVMENAELENMFYCWTPEGYTKGKVRKFPGKYKFFSVDIDKKNLENFTFSTAYWAFPWSDNGENEGDLVYKIFATYDGVLLISDERSMENMSKAIDTYDYFEAHSDDFHSDMAKEYTKFAGITTEPIIIGDTMLWAYIGYHQEDVKPLEINIELPDGTIKTIEGDYIDIADGITPYQTWKCLSMVKDYYFEKNWTIDWKMPDEGILNVEAHPNPLAIKLPGTYFANGGREFNLLDEKYKSTVEELLEQIKDVE